MPRYVVLEHDQPLLHWDLLLEVGEVLRAWRLSAPPADGVTVSAEPSFDHRLRYLEYEGPISGGRGRVVRWDHGTFVWGDQNEASVVVHLEGQRLRGRLSLQRAGEVWSATFSAGP